MKFRQLNSLTKEVLLVIYDRSARTGHQDWDLESAFKALGRDDFHSAGAVVLNLLIQRGWITNRTVSRLQGDQNSVALTERGRFVAIRFLESGEPKSPMQRLHSMQWATWGGLAAIVAALASIAAALFAYRAL